jgi:hypothetical protein
VQDAQGLVRHMHDFEAGQHPDLFAGEVLIVTDARRRLELIRLATRTAYPALKPAQISAVRWVAAAYARFSPTTEPPSFFQHGWNRAAGYAALFSLKYDVL